MLLLLKGDDVKLSAPKNIYSDNIVISTDLAIFARSKRSIKYRDPDNASDARDARDDGCQRKNYDFLCQLSPQKYKYLPPA